MPSRRPSSSKTSIPRKRSRVERRGGMGGFIRTWSLVFLDWSPGFVWVITFHVSKDFKRCRPKIFLVNNTAVTHNKSFYARCPIFRWCSCQCEPANHHAFHHKIKLAKRSGGALPLQNLKKVTVVWLGVALVALDDSARNVFSEWPAPSPIGVSPSQAILLAGGTY